MSLPPPIFYLTFRNPQRYSKMLRLQETIHQLQLARRRAGQPYQDILLLLEHKPVYTAGRRQLEEELRGDRTRLENIGADFETTKRGGQLTYHGPGQIVGYPLIDLARKELPQPIGIRDYICLLQKSLQAYLSQRHAIRTVSSEHTGLFLNPTTKIASIGVQVRHRLTTHGFALNITSEPFAWFDKIIACGLEDVVAGSVQSALGRPDSALQVEQELPYLLDGIQRTFSRDLAPLPMKRLYSLDEPIGDLLVEAEEDPGRALEAIMNDLSQELPPVSH